MKHFKLASFLVAAFICMNTLTAQITQKTGQWAIGAGFNIVEDAGGWHLGDVFDSRYNHFSSPFVVSAEYFTNGNFSFNASISFNKYEVGKMVDEQILQEGDEPKYMAVDFVTRFSFMDILNTTVFDPYLPAGFGYTKIGSYATDIGDVPEVGRMTFNTGLGANFWFTNAWGLNINYMLKFGIKAGDDKDFISNQTQLSFGFLYRFNNN